MQANDRIDRVNDAVVTDLQGGSITFMLVVADSIATNQCFQRAVRKMKSSCKYRYQFQIGDTVVLRKRLRRMTGHVRFILLRVAYDSEKSEEIQEQNVFYAKKEHSANIFRFSMHARRQQY